MSHQHTQKKQTNKDGLPPFGSGRRPVKIPVFTRKGQHRKNTTYPEVRFRQQAFCSCTSFQHIEQDWSRRRESQPVVWLDADPERLARRTAMNTNRPLLAGEEDPKAKLERLLHERKPAYKGLADLRIQTAELTPQETAYGVMESARVFFAKLKR